MLDSNLEFTGFADPIVADDESTAIVIGRTGLHRNAQLVVFVPTADADDAFTATLQLSLDGAVTWQPVCSVSFHAGYQGVRVAAANHEVPWQEYADADIQVRVAFDVTTAVTPSWAGVRAFIGCGEEEHYGRLATADSPLAGA